MNLDSLFIFSSVFESKAQGWEENPNDKSVPVAQELEEKSEPEHYRAITEGKPVSEKFNRFIVTVNWSYEGMSFGDSFDDLGAAKENARKEFNHHPDLYESVQIFDCSVREFVWEIKSHG